MNRDAPTFIGPIQKEQTLPRVFKYRFHVLQGKVGAAPIMLEYDTLRAAKESQATLMSSTNSYRVPSQRLFHALQMALNPKEGD